MSSYIHTGMLLKMKDGRKLLLKMNVEPRISNWREAAYVEVNAINDVLLRDPEDEFMDNEWHSFSMKTC